MAKYKIGITEQGDAALDLSWVDKLPSLDGAVLITKNLTPTFCRLVLENQEKIIVHATITGYGKTVFEPNVPTPQDSLVYARSLVDCGFPVEKVVIRVDPIIPTQRGIYIAKRIINNAITDGFYRFRVSLIDMYPHVQRRFKSAGLPLPYGEGRFLPLDSQVAAVNKMIKEISKDEAVRIESCAEPGLTAAIQSGCISDYDLKLLGLSSNGDYQCHCYDGKTELLTHKTQCPHKCVYCYWK